MKTICVDARLWGIAHTGPGRYTQNLLRHLPQAKNINIVVVVSPQNASQQELSRYHLIIAKHHPYSLASQFEMAAILYRLKPDLFHATHFTIPLFWWGKLVVTIHDLIKHYSVGLSTTTRHPILYWFKYFGYLLTVWLAVHRASHIIVPTQYWQQIIQKKYHLSPGKISVTYEGVDEQFLKASATHFPLPFSGPFVVHTGNLYPHKNITTLIKAVDSFSGKIKLALVCSRSVFASRLPASPHVYYLGRLTDEQVKSVYSQALAYVFPSYIEGFGLPGLEAMSAKLPVIASNSSCLPEIYGTAALYFNPHSAEELTSCIQQLLVSPTLRKKYISLGLKQFSRFSWQKLGEDTWAIYLKELR